MKILFSGIVRATVLLKPNRAQVRARRRRLLHTFCSPAGGPVHPPIPIDRSTTARTRARPLYVYVYVRVSTERAVTRRYCSTRPLDSWKCLLQNHARIGSSIIIPAHRRCMYHCTNGQQLLCRFFGTVCLVSNGCPCVAS